MFDQIGFAGEFFEALTAIDRSILAKVAAARCSHCGGPLHRGDYERKPRGGLIAIATELFTRRYSLCCGREGCRRRSTPPSVRFLGRRVYSGPVVVVASVLALAASSASASRKVTGIAPRTTRRWLGWWRGPFVWTSVFVALSALLVPTVARDRLPTSVLDRIPGPDTDRLTRLLVWLAPLTTESVVDGSRFVRGAV